MYYQTFLRLFSVKSFIVLFKKTIECNETITFNVYVVSFLFVSNILLYSSFRVGNRAQKVSLLKNVHIIKKYLRGNLMQMKFPLKLVVEGEGAY